MQLQKKKPETKPNPDLLNPHPRQAVQSLDRQARLFPLPSRLVLRQLLARASAAAEQANSKKERREGKTTCATRGFLTRARQMRPGGWEPQERAARQGRGRWWLARTLKPTKNPWKAFGIKASFIPRHKQVAITESLLLPRARALQPPGRQRSGPLLWSLKTSPKYLA